MAICLSVALLTAVAARSQTTGGPPAMFGEDGRWSVAAAGGFLGAVEGLRDDLFNVAGEDATCQDEWRICQDMQNALIQVYDHTYYVFHFNTDFNNKCLIRRLNVVQAVASTINYWDDWLRERYFNLGLADMAFEISQYASWPLCSRAGGTGVAGGSGAGGNTGGGGFGTGSSSGGSSGSGGGGGSGSGSGITLNESKVALYAARACGSANLETGRNWYFYNPNNSLSRGNYYEHSGYLCGDDGKKFYMLGDELLAFSCTSNWSNCQRNPGSDGTPKPPYENQQFNGKTYTSGMFEWSNSTYAAWVVLVE